MYLASGSHMVLCFQIWHWPCSGTRKFYSKDSINHCIANSGCGLPWVLGTYILNHPIRKSVTFSAFLIPPASFFFHCLSEKELLDKEQWHCMQVSLFGSAFFLFALQQLKHLIWESATFTTRDRGGNISKAQVHQ